MTVLENDVHSKLAIYFSKCDSKYLIHRLNAEWGCGWNTVPAPIKDALE